MDEIKQRLLLACNRIMSFADETGAAPEEVLANPSLDNDAKIAAQSFIELRDALYLSEEE